MPTIEIIFEHESDSGSIGELGIDEYGTLYWNGKLVLTEKKIRLRWWVNLSAILTAVSSFVLAIVATVTYFNDMKLIDKYIGTVSNHEKQIMLYNNEIKSLREQADQYRLYIEEAKESIEPENKTLNKALDTDSDDAGAG